MVIPPPPPPPPPISLGLRSNRAVNYDLSQAIALALHKAAAKSLQHARSQDIMEKAHPAGDL